jgi:hypothetical protein
MGLQQTKTLLHSKGNYFQNQKKMYRWEENFVVIHCSVKGLIFRVYKEFQKLNNKRIKTLINKWTTELNKRFSKEIQMAKKYIKNWATS